jgi:Holliday junction DNA helicase RuvA
LIAHLNGILAEKFADACIVEAGGVGYEVFVPVPVAAALPAVGEPVRLYTHFHVREDAQVLYGFLRTQERQVFLLLMTVKGVGPKLALGILSNLGAESVVGALQRRDLATLTKLPGVGKKLAERLGVELSDKAKELGLETGSAQPLALRRAVADLDLPGAWPSAMAALSSLGFSPSQARQAVEQAYKALGQDDVSLEDMVKAALKSV